MKFGLDHIVIAVSDLAQAIEDYRALGFNVQVGGRHPGRTSHNALVVFDDGAYLELIAWTAPSPTERWYAEHAQHGDGLTDFALVPEDVARAIDAAKSRGLALAGPIDGGRVRPDGRALEWQTARQSTFDLPFLCGDITPRELRVPRGEASRHGNGALGVASVAVAVFDLETSVARYAALLGLDATAGNAEAIPFVLPGLGLRIAAIRLATSTLALVAATGPLAAPSSPLATAMRKRLDTRGEGPCALAIATRGGDGARLLDPSRTHGALIEMVAPAA